MLLRLRALLAAGAVVLLAGCNDLEPAGDKGFVTGDGRVAQLAVDDRESPVDLSGEDLAGDPLDLADFRGKPVVVVVWGSWCAPCRAEAPDVVEAADRLGDDVQFLGLNIRDASPADAQRFVANMGIEYPSLYSPDGAALLAFSGTLSPNSIPSFVVLDPEGRVAASILGELPSTTTLVELAEDVLAENVDG